MPKKVVEWLVEEELKAEKRRRLNIDKNLAIVKATRRISRGKLAERRLYAIYRLYRYIGMSPKEISEMTGSRLDTIQRSIGSAFKRLCLKNQCVFATYFEKEEKQKT